MRVYRVGIVGHSPDRLRDPQLVKRQCREALLKLKSQYDDLYVNVPGSIGVPQWITSDCVDLDIPFNVFLPCPPDEQSQFWYKEQQDRFTEHLDLSSGITIAGRHYSEPGQQVCNKMLVDSSDFVICFWEGCLYGITFDTVRYAVKSSKIVLNALKDWGLVFKEQLQRPEQH